MLIPSFTTCVALDLQHLQEFRLASQTWKKWRPEIWANPMIGFVDTAPPPDGESLGWWTRLLARTTDHPRLKAVPWPPIAGASQRHRMLSAFVYGVAEHVETDWYLKIDTDALALKALSWTHPNWFQEKEPFEFVTSQWGYTKSIEMWNRLLAWAATVPAFQGLPEAPGSPHPMKDHVRHGRIISYVFFGRTRFLKEVAALHSGPLMPIESQDTYLWYVAARLGKRYAAVRMKKFGWFHGSRGMEKRVKAILEAG